MSRLRRRGRPWRRCLPQRRRRSSRRPLRRCARCWSLPFPGRPPSPSYCQPTGSARALGTAGSAVVAAAVSPRPAGHPTPDASGPPVAAPSSARDDDAIRQRVPPLPYVGRPATAPSGSISAATPVESASAARGYALSAHEDGQRLTGRDRDRGGRRPSVARGSALAARAPGCSIGCDRDLRDAGGHRDVLLGPGVAEG